ncbi:hypothetical protein UA45_19235 [Morganella morganii]|uniref:Uncharacterized protein n=1 Tax=Morganella morganii TaxID=582 RepID=A0A0D8L653_MORMO|nr:hypothetical protein UA45_19235 [Morganella morganii]
MHLPLPYIHIKKTRFERTLSDLITVLPSCCTQADTGLSGKIPSRQHNEREKQTSQTDIAN